VVTPRGKTPERIRTHNGSKRVKSAMDVLFGGFLKNGHPTAYQPQNSEDFALQKPFFAQNTYKSWRKPHQKSYSNRKQPMGISNLGLEISPEVEFWPLQRMRSRNWLKLHKIVVQFPKFLAI